MKNRKIPVLLRQACGAFFFDGLYENSPIIFFLERGTVINRFICTFVLDIVIIKQNNK